MKGYKKQILNHNVEKFSLIVRAYLDIFAFAKRLTQADQKAKLLVDVVSGRKKMIEDLK